MYQTHKIKAISLFLKSRNKYSWVSCNSHHQLYVSLMKFFTDTYLVFRSLIKVDSARVGLFNYWRKERVGRKVFLGNVLRVNQTVWSASPVAQDSSRGQNIVDVGFPFATSGVPHSGEFIRAIKRLLGVAMSSKLQDGMLVLFSSRGSSVLEWPRILPSAWIFE